MSRPDLLALGPEALASLSNVGLVKRAQRELAEGPGPALVEEDDGTVVGTFADGVVARLPPNKPLKEAPCTCGAAGVCRHRVAVALAYKPWHEAAHEAGPPPSARVPQDWSPGQIDDATLERVVGPKVLERARSVLKKGLLASVDRHGVPTAKLPSCTVRFLVPGDVAYARCDCAQAGGGCEHLALAVWAFRAADALPAKGGPEGAAVVVRLGGAEGASSGRGAALASAVSLVRDLLNAGVRDTTPLPARFAEVRTELRREGLTWMYAICTDLEIALEGYHKRSALYGSREIAALLVELAGRVRSAQAPTHELPARFVLGEDQAPETLLDHVRLVSLGARLRADGRERYADVYLADPDTTVVLVLRKRWDYAPDVEPEDGPGLARRTVAARLTLQAVATGQIVSKVVTRRANHTIDMSSSRTGQTSVTPQRGDWDSLPAPLLVRDLAEHDAWVRKRPPRMLRPRVLAEEVHAVAVSDVRAVVYEAAEQRITAQLADAAGNPFVLSARHQRVAPHALDAIAVALGQKVRFVAGELTRRAGFWELSPLSIAADGFVVPDVAGPTPAHTASGHGPRVVGDPLDSALTRAEAVLEELCHGGLGARAATVRPRLLQAAQALDDAGLAGLATRLRRLERPGTDGSGADAWLDAALRLTLLREASSALQA